MPKKTATDATQTLADVAGHPPERQPALEEEVTKREVAQRICELRRQAGRSSTELAQRVRTTQPVVLRREDADDEGHSLALIDRVAVAAERRDEIWFVPSRRRLQPA